MGEINEAARSILQLAVAHARAKLTSIGCLIGNAAYGFLNAGLQQVIILNACCLMILILQCRRPGPGSKEAGRDREGRVLTIFALHVVIACDVVSVIIDQASPSSLY